MVRGSLPTLDKTNYCNRDYRSNRDDHDAYLHDKISWMVQRYIYGVSVNLVGGSRYSDCIAIINVLTKALMRLAT